MEPKRLDECSLTLHHLSAEPFDGSLRDGSMEDGQGEVMSAGARKGNDMDEGGGELELDELELRETDDELVGEFDEESIAANACGWIDAFDDDDDDDDETGRGGGGGGNEERKSTVFSESRD